VAILIIVVSVAVIVAIIITLGEMGIIIPPQDKPSLNDKEKQRQLAEDRQMERDRIRLLYSSYLNDIDYKNWSFAVTEHDNKMWLVLNGTVAIALSRGLSREGVIDAAFSATQALELKLARDNFLYREKKIMAGEANVDIVSGSMVIVEKNET
jgi:hypothetical protein